MHYGFDGFTAVPDRINLQTELLKLQLRQFLVEGVVLGDQDSEFAVAGKYQPLTVLGFTKWFKIILRRRSIRGSTLARLS